MGRRDLESAATDSAPTRPSNRKSSRWLVGPLALLLFLTLLSLARPLQHLAIYVPTPLRLAGEDTLVTPRRDNAGARLLRPRPLLWRRLIPGTR